MECLNHCVQMIDRIGNVTRDVAVLTPTPLQTQTLLAKVRDVADTYLQTVQAAGKAIGKDMNDPSMGVLMKKATSLTSVLTTLMRSLRVFTQINNETNIQRLYKMILTSFAEIPQYIMKPILRQI